MLECIELCILRFAHDTPPAPSREGSSLAYCHSEEHRDEESRVHPRVHPSLCSRDPSLHSVSLWMRRGGEGICTPWRNKSRYKQENVALRPILRRFSYTAKMIQTESRIKFIWLCRGAAHLASAKIQRQKRDVKCFGIKFQI